VISTAKPPKIAPGSGVSGPTGIITESPVKPDIAKAQPYIIIDFTGDICASFYCNDCGEPHGGFEYCGSFYANITLDNSVGELILELKIGIGDPLQKHVYNLEFIKGIKKDRIEFLLEGEPLVLEWVEEDLVWNKWDNHYIASYSVGLPPEDGGRDGFGIIHPDMFPGLVSWYYVELRIPEIF